MGLFSSGAILPLMSQTIKSGARVIETSAANNIAPVLVKARGLKRRPSWASSVKTGRKEIVIMSRETKSGFPTSWAARMITAAREPGLPSRSHCSNRLWAFSIMTMTASTMVPMAIAMPASDMMFDVTPR